MLANLNSSCMLRAFLQKYLGPPQTRHLVVDNYSGYRRLNVIDN